MAGRMNGVETNIAGRAVELRAGPVLDSEAGRGRPISRQMQAATARQDVLRERESRRTDSGRRSVDEVASPPIAVA